jgi:hypothetical protein
LIEAVTVILAEFVPGGIVIVVGGAPFFFFVRTAVPLIE